MPLLKFQQHTRKISMIISYVNNYGVSVEKLGQKLIGNYQSYSNSNFANGTKTFINYVGYVGSHFDIILLTF